MSLDRGQHPPNLNRTDLGIILNDTICIYTHQNAFICTMQGGEPPCTMSLLVECAL